MSYIIAPNDIRGNKIVVVGCGGTGGFVAEGLCRFLPPEADLLFIDHDRVEPHNLIRQHFYPGDLGKFKSQVLAERFAHLYRRTIGYSVYPYKRDNVDESSPFGRAIRSAIIIGCVDNAAARKDMSNLKLNDWWIDSGNGFQSGQVLIGNTINKDSLKQGFNEKFGIVNRIPAPSLQLPSLLAPPTKPEPRRDCAQEIEAGDQSPVINQFMGTLILDFVYKLLRGELTQIGAYIDLGAGTLSMVPAEPITVARMMSIKVNELIAKQKPIEVEQRVRLHV